MKNVIGFYCSRCHLDFSASDCGALCPKCKFSFEVKMSLSDLPPGLKEEIRARPRGMWRWKEFLPISSSTKIVSLGEGDTPLIAAGQLGQELNLPGLYFKAEHLLPTGSLKDRAVALGIHHALSVSAKAVAVASTGNHAASVAAYAAAAGLKAFIFIPEKTDQAKISQSAIHGATVIRVKGTMEDAGKLLRYAIDEFNWYPCLSSNPYRNEGKKTCAYEVWEQLEEKAPDYMVHPIGGGIGLWGAWKGWQELHNLKWVSKIPKMIGAQSAQAAPIGAAWDRGAEDADRVELKFTYAESIALSSVTPGVGYRTLQAMRQSSGSCISLTDKEILDARDLLARRAGLFVEPAAAASLAAIIAMAKKNEIKSHHQIVCVLTGLGLKQTLESSALASIITVNPNQDDLKYALKEAKVLI